MASLFEDLRTYSNEAYHKDDFKAGLKIIGEIAGIITVTGFLGAGAFALSAWLPTVGITVSASVLTRLVFQLTKCYSQLDTQQRRQVRAVCRSINGFLNPVDWLDTSVNLLESPAFEMAETVSKKVDKLTAK